MSKCHIVGNHMPRLLNEIAFTDKNSSELRVGVLMSYGHMENIGFIRKNANSLPKVAFISSPERNWNMLWTVPAHWPIVR